MLIGANVVFRGTMVERDDRLTRLTLPQFTEILLRHRTQTSTQDRSSGNQAVAVYRASPVQVASASVCIPHPRVVRMAVNRYEPALYVCITGLKHRLGLHQLQYEVV